MSKPLKPGDIFKAISPTEKDVIGVVLNHEKAYLFTQFGENYSQGEGQIPKDAIKIETHDSYLVKHHELRLAVAAIKSLVLTVEW